jgi:hypothetical protein
VRAALPALERSRGARHHGRLDAGPARAPRRDGPTARASSASSASRARSPSSWATASASRCCSRAGCDALLRRTARTLQPRRHSTSTIRDVRAGRPVRAPPARGCELRETGRRAGDRAVLAVSRLAARRLRALGSATF